MYGTTGAASGLPTGKRQHKPFTITKHIDKSTPKIYSVLVNNENIPDIPIRVEASTEFRLHMLKRRK